jgi:rare lipoprotein A
MKSRISLLAPLALLGACGGGDGGLEELPPAPTAETPERYPRREEPTGDLPAADSSYRRPDGSAASVPRTAPGTGQRPAGADYARPEAPEDGAPPPMEGPQGSSRPRPGEERFDQVGYAGYAGAGEGVFATSGMLRAGSYAEVTALDTGKTILIAIRGQGQGLIDLSGAAARQLGVSGNPAVRVRRVTVTPQDAALLDAGQPAPARGDAPPALLAGLRKRLSGASAALPPEDNAPPPRQPTRASPPAQPPRATRGLFVQIAALSSAQRAQALARDVRGVVRSGGGVYRVQTGPYPTAAAAERARADHARRGYGDARVVSVP